MKGAFFFGILLSVVVLADLGLWIVLSTMDYSFEETKALYLSYFPVLLRNATLLTGLSIALGMTSIYLLNRSKVIPGKLYRAVGQAFMYLNIVLVCWMVFSLM